MLAKVQRQRHDVASGGDPASTTGVTGHFTAGRFISSVDQLRLPTINLTVITSLAEKFNGKHSCQYRGEELTAGILRKITCSLVMSGGINSANEVGPALRLVTEDRNRPKIINLIQFLTALFIAKQVPNDIIPLVSTHIETIFPFSTQEEAKILIALCYGNSEHIRQQANHNHHQQCEYSPNILAFFRQIDFTPAQDTWNANAIVSSIQYNNAHPHIPQLPHGCEDCTRRFVLRQYPFFQQHENHPPFALRMVGSSNTQQRRHDRLAITARDDSDSTRESGTAHSSSATHDGSHHTPPGTLIITEIQALAHEMQEAFDVIHRERDPQIRLQRTQTAIRRCATGLLTADSQTENVQMAMQLCQQEPAHPVLDILRRLYVLEDQINAFDEQSLAESDTMTACEHSLNGNPQLKDDIAEHIATQWLAIANSRDEFTQHIAIGINRELNSIIFRAITISIEEKEPGYGSTTCGTWEQCQTIFSRGEHHYPGTSWVNTASRALTGEREAALADQDAERDAIFAHKNRFIIQLLLSFKTSPSFTANMLEYSLISPNIDTARHAIPIIFFMLMPTTTRTERASQQVAPATDIRIIEKVLEVFTILYNHHIAPTVDGQQYNFVSLFVAALQSRTPLTYPGIQSSQQYTFRAKVSNVLRQSITSVMTLLRITHTMTEVCSIKSIEIALSSLFLFIMNQAHLTRQDMESAASTISSTSLLTATTRRRLMLTSSQRDGSSSHNLTRNSWWGDTGSDEEEATSTSMSTTRQQHRNKRARMMTAAATDIVHQSSEDEADEGETSQRVLVGASHMTRTDGGTRGADRPPQPLTPLSIAISNLDSTPEAKQIFIAMNMAYLANNRTFLEASPTLATQHPLMTTITLVNRPNAAPLFANNLVQALSLASTSQEVRTAILQHTLPAIPILQQAVQQNMLTQMTAQTTLASNLAIAQIFTNLNMIFVMANMATMASLPTLQQCQDQSQILSTTRALSTISLQVNDTLAATLVTALNLPTITATTRQATLQQVLPAIPLLHQAVSAELQRRIAATGKK